MSVKKHYKPVIDVVTRESKTAINGFVWLRTNKMGVFFGSVQLIL